MKPIPESQPLYLSLICTSWILQVPLSHEHMHKVKGETKLSRGTKGASEREEGLLLGMHLEPEQHVFF